MKTLLYIKFNYTVTVHVVITYYILTACEENEKCITVVVFSPLLLLIIDVQKYVLSTDVHFWQAQISRPAFSRVSAGPTISAALYDL